MMSRNTPEPISESLTVFDKLADFIAGQTSRNENVQRWLSSEFHRTGTIDVTALVGFAKSASMRVSNNGEMALSFTDDKNVVHNHMLTSAESNRLLSILGNESFSGSDRQKLLSLYLSGISTSTFAADRYNQMSNQNDSSYSIHR